VTLLDACRNREKITIKSGGVTYEGFIEQYSDVSRDDGYDWRPPARDGTLMLYQPPPVVELRIALDVVKPEKKELEMPLRIDASGGTRAGYLKDLSDQCRIPGHEGAPPGHSHALPQGSYMVYANHNPFPSWGESVFESFNTDRANPQPTKSEEDNDMPQFPKVTTIVNQRNDTAEFFKEVDVDVFEDEDGEEIGRAPTEDKPVWRTFTLADLALIVPVANTIVRN
jgi:hypothetical protein